MLNSRFLIGVFFSSLAGLLLAGIVQWAQQRPSFPAESQALETAFAQGFLAGFTVDPYESRDEEVGAGERVASPAGAAQRLYKDALIFYVQQDRARALELLERASQADPSDLKIRNALARIRREGG